MLSRRLIHAFYRSGCHTNKRFVPRTPLMCAVRDVYPQLKVQSVRERRNGAAEDFAKSILKISNTRQRETEHGVPDGAEGLFMTN